MLANNWSNQLLAQPSNTTGGKGDFEKRKLGSHGSRPGGGGVRATLPAED
jgi:hypothetical protein